MKTTILFLFSAFAMTGATLIALLGCGGTDSGSDPTPIATSTSTGGTSTPPKLTCDDYCTEVMVDCTAGYQQYVDASHCKAVCASFPEGTLSDTKNDTLGCRIYHGGGPAKANAALHCGHSGPNGGDIDPTDGAVGPACGEGCEAFCNLAETACTGANQQYTDTAACMAECKTFKASTKPFDVSQTSADDFNCRFYHASAASIDPATHCKHIVANSAVCIK
jgi:hypothetical protein